jgi:hypothetical protein
MRLKLNASCCNQRASPLQNPCRKGADITKYPSRRKRNITLLIPQDPSADQFAHRPFALAWHVELRIMLAWCSEPQTV